MAMFCQGDGYTIEKTIDGKVKFTGRSILAEDNNRYYIKLQSEGQEVENFSFESPKTIIGNLIIGETYIEPQGMTEVINYKTGEKCQLDFFQRGWISSNKEAVLGVIKDAQGKARYHLQGKYT